MDPTPTETKESPTVTSAGAGVFRSQVTAVTVPFTVTGANQVPLLDLASSECHVLEDGVEQTIAGFAQSDAASHVAIVLDTSGSMAWTVLRLRDTIDEVLRAMRPQDPLMLLTFDEHIRIQAEFTTDRARVHDSIAGFARSWGTRLYDAIDLAVHDRMEQVEGRKAVVLLTDGVDTRSRLADGPTTLADVQAANTAVYVIRYAPSYDMVPTWLSTHTNAERFVLVADDAQRAPSGTDPIGEYLQTLCRATGGRQYVVRDILALQPAFREIATELSHQYTLYYYPSNTRRDGTVRRITMAIDRPGAVVHARTAYRAASR
jgi:Ca-activated chloride channel family protein